MSELQFEQIFKLLKRDDKEGGDSDEDGGDKAEVDHDNMEISEMITLL